MSEVVKTSKSKTIIRFTRDKNIESDKSAAIAALNNFQNVVGQPVMVRYHRDADTPGTEGVDAILAIGTSNGVGPGTYRIIFFGSERAIIWGIFSTPGQYPDVSSLANGEIYIVKNEEGVYCYCWAVDNVRQVLPIQGGPYKYFNLSDDFIWYFDPDTQSVRQEGDFFSQEEMSGKLSEIFEEMQRQQDMIENLENKLFPFSCSLTYSPNSIPVQPINTASSTVQVTLKGLKQKSDGSGNEDVTGRTQFSYRIDSGTWTNIEGNVLSFSARRTDGGYGSVVYSFRGNNTDYGNFGVNVSAGSVTINFGLPYLYGVVNSSWVPSSSTLASDLSASGNQMKTSSISQSYTTANLNSFPVFCVPAGWNVTKITDQNGYLVTSGWENKGSYSYSISGKSVSYQVWKKKDGAIATNFRYTFTIG